MLAVIPEEGSTIDSDLVRTFRMLSSCGMVTPGSKPGHSDGWGMVSWKDGSPFYLGREPTNASRDPMYEIACDQIDSLNLKSPLIVHLRKASVGLKIRENTHPFLKDSWAFAHNGTIRRLNLKVTTDSLWFFECMMREYVRDGNDIIRAIKAQIGAVHGIYPYTSITFLLSNGKELYAYRDCTKNQEYYGMYFTRTENTFVICQEKFFNSNWQEIRNGELFEIDRSLKHRIVPLDEPTPLVN